MILDCNLTYGAANDGKPYRGCDTFAELTAELDRAGIDGGLVRCRYSDTVGVRYGNGFAARDTRQAADAGRWMRGVWAVLPPDTGETPSPAELPSEMARHNIAAVYINPEAHRFQPDPITLGETFEVLQQRRIPLILSTANGVPMELIYRILRDFPRLTAIVADQYNWPNGRRLYPLANHYENLYLDLSYIMDAGGVEDMTRRFGAERLLFGTAFPERYTGSMLAVVRAAGVTE
ncbi:MAG: amidohydrolase family protein, partial [Oscillospiraceae bacterium]|nr:amidohydrolase family protein [Oscillospiraceae bacterium]